LTQRSCRRGMNTHGKVIPRQYENVLVYPLPTNATPDIQRDRCERIARTVGEPELQLADTGHKEHVSKFVPSPAIVGGDAERPQPTERFHSVPRPCARGEFYLLAQDAFPWSDALRSSSARRKIKCPTLNLHARIESSDPSLPGPACIPER